MARRVGAALYEFESERRRLLRYCVLLWRTARVILRSRPDIIYFQNPSIMLAIAVVVMKSLRLTRAAIVGDFHNAGVCPPVGRVLVPFLARGCDLVIVSNKSLETRVVRMGARCLSLPDPLPELPMIPAVRSQDGKFRVLMVCSWADDEPVAEVLRAAENLLTCSPSVAFEITGRPSLERRGWSRPLPENVSLTGFLSETEFVRKLRSSDLVMDLTTREDCMVCGAYEAVSAEVPIIVSANEPMMRYFRKGAVFTDNSADSITQCIVDAVARREVLAREVKELKYGILAEEGNMVQTVVDAVEEAVSRRRRA